MCEHGRSALVRVKVPADLAAEGHEKWKDAAIDECIAPLVAALQGGGIDMCGSCCGHGQRDGHIDLQDGRGLLILSPERNTAYLTNPRVAPLGFGERGVGGMKKWTVVRYPAPAPVSSSSGTGSGEKILWSLAWPRR